MVNVSALKAKNLDFNLATHSEICLELGARLKDQRLVKNFKQIDLAARSGVAVGTIKNIESKGKCSLETLVRVAVALDLVSELQAIFTLKIRSISEMEKIEKLKEQKVPRRAR